MIEGLTTLEIADYVDSVVRRGRAFAEIHPVKPILPWSTFSGFSDPTIFFDMLSRSWPMFPATGDLIYLEKHFSWVKYAIINPNVAKVIALDELSDQ